MSLPKDLVPGCLILLLCAALYFVTTTFDSDPLGAAQGMPATHMPRLVLGVISALALLMILQGLRSGEKGTLHIPPWPMWATVGLLGLAAMAAPVLGVPIAFFIVCAVLPLLWGARDVRIIAAFALAVPAAIYVVFQILLGLRLPLGPLTFLS